MRKVEVLPQPDGPSRQQYEPAGILRLIASTAVTLPNLFVNCTSSSAAVVVIRIARIEDPSDLGASARLKMDATDVPKSGRPGWLDEIGALPLSRRCTTSRRWQRCPDFVPWPEQFRL